MMVERMWGAGLVSGALGGFVAGALLVSILVFAAMGGDNPKIVSVAGEEGKPCVVEIGGTVYRLVSESRYSELRSYEWTVKNGR